MAEEKGLSQSLRYQAEKYLGSMGIKSEAPVVVAGIAIDFPYSWVRQAGYDEYVPEGAWKNYEAMKALFTPESLSPEWVSFIKEVDKERKANGCKEPVNLVYGLYFLTEEGPLAQKAGLPRFEKLDDGVINFQDGTIITKLIDTVLANPELRREYKHLLNFMVPDKSHIPLDETEVQKVLGKMGIKGGLLLDLGCGIGRNTEEWSAKLGLFTVGLERQYHCQWYDPYWKEKCKEHTNLGFVLGDFGRGVPFKDVCADVAIFQHVVQHITQGSLEKGLREALRVLKNEGWLFVGPQHTKDHSGWRFFKKEAVSDGKEFHFKEYKYYDLVPEDKPKRWRRGKISKSQLSGPV